MLPLPPPPSPPVVVSCLRPWRIVPYVEALLRTGWREDEILVLSPSCGHDPRAVACQAAGVVLCGGVDIEPVRYGEAPLPGFGDEWSPARDAMELELLAGAQEAGTPVLGICRGLQLINVFFGGTLWQDLPTQRPSAIRHAVTQPLDALAHDFAVADLDHPLAARLRQGPARCNSRHHQGIARLGAGLEVIATAPDGLIEAVALSPAADWWLHAVQWHPENLVDREPHRGLFLDFHAVAHAPRTASAITEVLT